MMRLRDYQETIAQRAVGTLRRHGLCYLAMECRVGKTLTALRAAQLYGAKNVLFLTKLKALPSVKSDFDMLAPCFQMTAVNYESAHKCKPCFDFVILDEAHCLGAYPKPCKRVLSARKLCDGRPVLFLSGTPTPEGYSQLYHQLWVCGARSPFAQFKTFYKWARAGYVDVRQKMVRGVRINDYSRANRAMIDAATRHLFITYTQAEAGIDVAMNEEVATVEMSPLTHRLLREMDRRRVTQCDGHVITGDTAATCLTKLHQMSSGTVKDEFGIPVIFDSSKCAYIKRHFRGLKLAIFYVFDAEGEMIRKAFPDNTDDPELFQCSDALTFVCQIRRGREGTRLDTADALIYFNLEFSYLSYEQGRNRLVSKERQEGVRIVFLASDCGIEREVLERVRGKSNYTTEYYLASRKAASCA